jgi:hypothetical protein
MRCHFYTENAIILPRQARAKHRESSQKESGVFLQDACPAEHCPASAGCANASFCQSGTPGSCCNWPHVSVPQAIRRCRSFLVFSAWQIACNVYYTQDKTLRRLIHLIFSDCSNEIEVTNSLGIKSFSLRIWLIISNIIHEWYWYNIYNWFEQSQAGQTNWTQVKKRVILRHFYIKCIILPRQARDKHRENSKKRAVFLQQTRSCGTRSSSCWARTTRR